MILEIKRINGSKEVDTIHGAKEYRDKFSPKVRINKAGKTSYISPGINEEIRVLSGSKTILEIRGPNWLTMTENLKQIYFEMLFDIKAQYKKTGKQYEKKVYVYWKDWIDALIKGSPLSKELEHKFKEGMKEQ